MECGDQDIVPGSAHVICQMACIWDELLFMAITSADCGCLGIFNDTIT